MKLFALTVPGSNGPIDIVAPSNVPTGGLSGDGGKILKISIEWLLVAAVIISLGFIIYGALNYIMSEGDKTKVESARRTIVFSIIGLLVVFLSFFVISFIGSALKVDFLKPSF